MNFYSYIIFLISFLFCGYFMMLLTLIRYDVIFEKMSKNKS
ncbi:hypothetical protein HMPREF0645_0163 [Hallella bergensis DSM 17361]|uniref:Uncharacterized protein n=1 Tax=Hallella bergensis DSM 17361 TaxID=585502 RepID=D1PT78_9BACT|nr:hypothetical protein HMPREF0645_0163 [Hallella bergensis DSM 17361]